MTEGSRAKKTDAPAAGKAGKAGKAGAAGRPARPGKGASTASPAGAGAVTDPFAHLSFEAALSQLEGIVDRLEEGELDLADALAGFEEGVQLTKHCHAQLEAAERRVEILTRAGGEWSTRPFAEHAEDAEQADDAHETDEIDETDEDDD